MCNVFCHVVVVLCLFWRRNFDQEDVCVFRSIIGHEALSKRDIKYIFINLNVQTVRILRHMFRTGVLIYITVTSVCIRQTCCKTWKFFSSSQKRWIMFRCGIYKQNVTHAFVFLWHYNRWNLQCVASLVQKGWNKELLRDLTSCRVCILSGKG